MDSLPTEIQLEMHLAKIKRSGEFCCGGVFRDLHPGIIVKDFGMLGLPMAVDKAEVLTKVCSLIQFDCGEESSVDKPAGKTWQLDPSQFKICNPEWHSAVEQLVYGDMKSELGLPSAGSITVELKGLFLCDEGRCCLPQLDAEKDNHTFARLVLLLPSVYSGGELVVAHKDKKMTFSYVAEGTFKNHYVAFYADCIPQFQSFKSGNLLALIYNLNLSNFLYQPIKPADTYEVVSNVYQVLQQWQTRSLKGQKSLDPKSLIIVLNLSCGKSALSWGKLKGRDRAIASVVKSALEELPIDVFLCLIYYTRYFGCDADEYHDFHEGLECGNSSDEDGKREDVAYEGNSSVSGESETSSNGSWDDEDELDSGCHVSHFIKTNGKRCKVEKVDFCMSEIIPSNAFKRQPSYKEYVTTEGPNRVKCYRRAALLLQPSKDFSQIVNDGSLNEVVDLALECANNLSKKKSVEMNQKCHTAITAVVSRIEKLKRGEVKLGVSVPNPQDCVKLLKALQLTNNICLFSWFVSKVVMPQVHCHAVEAVFFHMATSVAQFGLDQVLTAFQSLVINGLTPTIMNLLKDLCVANIGVIDAPKELTHLLASTLLGRLVDVQDKNLEEAHKFRSLNDLYRDAIIAVTDLFCIYSTLSNEDWLQQAINYVRRTPLRHPVEIVLASALENWHKWLKDQTRNSLTNASNYQFAVKQQICLLEDCVKQLQLVREPKESTESCGNPSPACECDNCKTIENFTNDPGRNVLSLILPKSGIQHLTEKGFLKSLEILSKDMDGRHFKDEAIQMVTLKKRKDSLRPREKYDRCQAVICSLIALLPPNNPLKRRPNEDIIEVPLTKMAKK